MNILRQTNPAKEAQGEHGIEQPAKPLLRMETTQSKLSGKMDNIIEGMLRKEKVMKLAKKLDEFMGVVREHRIIGALCLLDLDLPIAVPSAMGVAIKLYDLALTPQMLLTFEITETLILLGIEYSMVRGFVAVYDKFKQHFLLKNNPNIA